MTDIGSDLLALAARERRIGLITGAALAVLVAAGAGFIWFTAAQVSSANEQLAKANADLAQANKDLAKVRTDLDTARDQLSRSLGFVSFLHPVNMGDAKSGALASAKLAAIWGGILDAQRSGVRYANPSVPKTAFNSPGFAEFVLGKSLSTLQSLPADARPEPGDIVRYEPDYALFYFRDLEGRPFVIGMTPAGIVALQEDFGVKRTGVLRTGS